MNRTDAIKRFLGSRTYRVQRDALGRISLPKPLLEAVGISNVALLVGKLNCFEIWSPEKFDAREAAQE
jgi:DNA-binding transcriptional regulator/RsmH inhibitor MraZ